MLKQSRAFSGFSVKDLDATKKFYKDTLQLTVEEDAMGLHLHTHGNTPIFVYAKEDHIPAEYTMLNFIVDDIDAVLEELTKNGVVFEQYDWGNGAKTDSKGIMHGKVAHQGPDIAWFKDPSGNILAIIEE